MLDVWEVPEEEVVPSEWFWLHGIDIFPTINKVPDVPKGTSQFHYRCTHAEAASFREYGVPGGVRKGYADGLTIVDADGAKTKAWAVANLPLTPFTVTTGPCHDGSDDRGLHFYFRTRSPLPSFIRRDGLSLENRNQGLYAVGPGSVRPDDVVYRASAWSWRWQDIPYLPDGFLFDDGSCGTFSTPGLPYEIPEIAVPAGERHYQLFRFVRHCKSFADDKRQAREFVAWFNQERCRPPLPEDRAFERWFDRAWNQRDRPFGAPAGYPTRFDLGAPIAIAPLRGLREL